MSLMQLDKARLESDAFCLATPFVDKARAKILAARQLRDYCARRFYLRQNPRPVIVVPPTPAFVPSDQHATHNVQLASLIKPT